MMVAASPPPAETIRQAEEAGLSVCHVYGLTEVYGPAVVCEPREKWDGLSPEDRARKMARQGVPYVTQASLAVLDPDTGQPVPRDGKTMGELAMRGNLTFKGYLHDDAATEMAFRHGHFMTGDLGVVDEDGYAAIKDRSKDIVITGGEKVSSIEVEAVLHQHPAVADIAVVARPHTRWGESPCAFIELTDGHGDTTEKTLISYAKERLAGFQVPGSIVFGAIPKTPTGKIQKNILRQRARDLGPIGPLDSKP